MSDRVWAFGGDQTEVAKAIGDALGLASGQPLLQVVGPKQVGVEYAISEDLQKLNQSKISGVTAYTRRVLVKVEIVERGLRRRLDEDAKSQALDAADKVIDEVKARQAVDDSSPQVVYKRHNNGYDLGYEAAMWQDFAAGLLPFQLNDKTLTRSSDGAEVGSLVVWTRNFRIESFDPNAFTVDVRLTLTSASEAEVRTMVTAMRAWIRGKALSDRLPLQLPKNDAGLQ